ncbi:hypothetical protein QBC37DRAFT_299683 [Rhypophila decipiens]|uniref:Malonyl-CoA:ACP transacylase (MAT) domain-containing protein n=1 Tax=Rhypophila decipiens TaxID=261697 RepID=A0AAN7B3L9_9PEZI|nr:hypothetical protein QBC37DRAFT_299683 [Rhypophila decipiens]
MPGIFNGQCAQWPAMGSQLLKRLPAAEFSQPLYNAIQIILQIMQDEGKLARPLKVDRAYHPHHIHTYTPTHVDALQACQIRNPKPTLSQGTKQISSVTGRLIENLAGFNEALESRYWDDNMAQSVLFSQAVEHAMMGPFMAIIEVGPHPALRSPVLETIRSVPANVAEGNDDVLSVSKMLGSLWELFESRAFQVHFMRFDEMMGDASG